MLGLIFAIAAISAIIKSVLEIRMSYHSPSCRTVKPSKNLVSFLFQLD